MDVEISIDDLCSDLHKFLEAKKDARNELINSLMKSFPRDKNAIAAYRKGDAGSEPLSKWILAHPTCIPLLAKCLEKNEKNILERLKTKANEYRASNFKINTAAGNFLKVWGNDYENLPEGTTLERLSILEKTLNCVVQQVMTQGQKLDAQQAHIGEQDNKIKHLLNKIEFLEQEISRKNAQIQKLTEDNQTLTADKQGLEKKIKQLEKEKKGLEESRNDCRQKLEKEKMKRQAEKESWMQDKQRLEQENKDLREMLQGSDENDPNDLIKISIK